MRKSFVKLLLFILVIILTPFIATLIIMISNDGFGALGEIIDDFKSEPKKLQKQEFVKIISNNSIIYFSGEQVIVTDIYDMVVEPDVPELYRDWDYPVKIQEIQDDKYGYNSDYVVEKIVVDDKEFYCVDDDFYYDEVLEQKDKEFFDGGSIYYYDDELGGKGYLKTDVIENFQMPNTSQRIFFVKRNDIENDGKFWIEEHRINKLDDKYRVFEDEEYIDVDEFCFDEPGEHTLKIVYVYDANKVIKEYDDICVMNILPKQANISVLTNEIIDNNVRVAEEGVDLLKENTNSYAIKDNRIKEEIDSEKLTLLIDKNIIKGGQKVEENYIYMPEKLEKMVNSEYFWILKTMFIISIITCILSIILTRKPRIKKKYIRECENLINPIMAEALIDSKIDAKELTMTCILSAIKKGALEVIDNDTIEYRTDEVLNETEKIVVSMIFNGCLRRIKIDDMKKIFIKDNIETERIYIGFLKIKNNILAELKKIGIYGKNSKIILRTMKIISILMLANIIPIMIWILDLISMENEFDANTVIGGINVVLIMFIIRLIDAEEKGQLPERDDDPRTGLYSGMMIIFSVILCLFGIFNLEKNIYAIIIVLIISILNFVTYLNSKKQILTKKGKEEYRKVLALKNYIKDYSIMEKRDMEEVILWDDYLIYATAFGIPNKVTDKFAEGFLKANINLQKINRLLGFK